MTEEAKKTVAPVTPEAPKTPKPKEAQTPLPANDLGKSLELVAASVGNLISALAAALGKQTADNIETISKHVTTKIDDGLAALVGDDKPKKKKAKPKATPETKKAP